MSTQQPEPERGVSPMARSDRAWGPRLKALADALSPGDKSVLRAMLAEDTGDEPVAVTSRGSANDWFWAHLSNVGLMEPRPDAVTEALRTRIIGYALTGEGRRVLPHMLRGLF